MALAAAEGVEALSMRKLARHLDYEVMSLYNHIANKSDLLEAMVDRVAGEIDTPEIDLAWRPAVRLIATSAHEALLRHPWSAPLWSSAWPGPNRWRLMEALLDLLGNAGFPDDVADLAFHAVTLHINGFTQQQITYRDQTADGGEDEMLARFETDVPEVEFPRIHEHMRYHRERDAGSDTPVDEFGYVLDLILDGLEQARLTGTVGRDSGS